MVLLVLIVLILSRFHHWRNSSSCAELLHHIGGADEETTEPLPPPNFLESIEILSYFEVRKQQNFDLQNNFINQNEGKKVDKNFSFFKVVIVMEGIRVARSTFLERRNVSFGLRFFQFS